MKIVRFSQNGHAPRLGCLVGNDRVMDLAAGAAAYLAGRGVTRAQAIADALFPQSTREFLEGGAASQDALAAMMEAVKGGKLAGAMTPLASVRLHAPIADPGKFICIGLNYTDHAAETNNPAPKQPPVFPKWANTILDPGEPILRPRGEKTLDWEVELGVVIGRTARYVSKEQALAISSSTPRSGAPGRSATPSRRWGHTSPIAPRSRIPTPSTSRPGSTALSCRTATPRTSSSTSAIS